MLYLLFFLIGLMSWRNIQYIAYVPGDRVTMYPRDSCYLSLRYASLEELMDEFALTTELVFFGG